MFEKKVDIVKNDTKQKKQRSRTNLIIHQNWVIFKLLVRLFFNDWIGVFAVLIFPMLISIIYFVMYKNGYFTETIFSGVKGVLPTITTIKIWYEFLIYAVGFGAFVYLAISISDIKNTILFKKMITGFTTKINLLFLLFLLYALIVVLIIGLKITVLMFYPSFRNTIIKETNWGYMILGTLLFVVTNLSLGVLFGSLKIPTKGVIPLTIIVFFVLLFFAGLWFAPTDIEGLFLINIKKNRLNFATINDGAKLWRTLTFISPFQPSLEILAIASNNDSTENYLVVDEWVFRERSLITSIYSSFGEKQDENKYYHKVSLSSLENFKKEILTDAGVAKWKLWFEKANSSGRIDQNQLSVLKEDIDIFVAGYRAQRIDILPNVNFDKNQLWSWNNSFYTITLKRPMIYSNYLEPVMINLGWIAVINGITAFLWKKNLTLTG